MSSGPFLSLAQRKWTQDSVYSTCRIALFHVEARRVTGSTCLHEDTLSLLGDDGEFFMTASNVCASPAPGLAGHHTIVTGQAS